MLARVVAAVAHDNQRFFVPMPQAQMIEPFGYSVIQRGSSAGSNGPYRFLELVWVVCERFSVQQLEPDLIVKIHDEHLVLRIARLCEGGNRSGDLRQLGPHAAAVVNNQAYSYRGVAALKNGDFLLSPILVYLEVVLTESGNQLSVPPRHSDGQHDEFCLHRNRGLAGSDSSMRNWLRISLKAAKKQNDCEQITTTKKIEPMRSNGRDHWQVSLRRGRRTFDPFRDAPEFRCKYECYLTRRFSVNATPSEPKPRSAIRGTGLAVFGNC